MAKTKEQIKKPNRLTRWILIRHCDVDDHWITKEQYCKNKISLNSNGQKQADEFVKYLTNQNLKPSDTVFIISPLTRAVQSINPYFKAEYNLDLEKSEKYEKISDQFLSLVSSDWLSSIEERKWHIYEIESNILIDFRLAQIYNKKHNESISWKYHKNRIKEMWNLIDEYNTKFAGKKIVIVSHGPVLRALKFNYLESQKDVVNLDYRKQARWTVKNLFFYDGKPYQTLTKVILVRHGRTDYNEKNLLDSLWKAKLNKIWQKQSDFILEKYKDENIYAIYSSPLQRCKDTISKLAKNKKLDIWEDGRIIDLQIPEYQDKDFDSIDIKFNTNPICKDGESVIDVYNRVSKFLIETIHKHSWQTIVICSHGDPLFLMEKFLSDFDYNKDKDKHYIDNEEGKIPSKVLYVMSDMVKELDLHKPYIDYFDIIKNNKKYKRITEVLDPWMESASMPYAQVHYPFENKEKFEASFPADYIAEYTGQIRAWFYVMHVLGTILFDKPAFTNVVCTGVMAGNDGRKMSKSYWNYPDPAKSFEQYGWDAIRMAIINTPIVYGGDMAIKEELFLEAIKSTILPFWNAFYFFTTYANIDGWKPNTEISKGSWPLVPGVSCRDFAMQHLYSKPIFGTSHPNEEERDWCYGLIYNPKTNKYLVIPYGTDEIKYFLPWWGKEKWEDSKQAMLREIQEEVGLTDLKVLGGSIEFVAHYFAGWEKQVYRKNNVSLFLLELDPKLAENGKLLEKSLAKWEHKAQRVDFDDLMANIVKPWFDRWIRQIIAESGHIIRREYETNPEVKTVKKDLIVAIVKNPKNDNFLVIDRVQWWKTFVGGWIEKWEDIIEAGKREFLEEAWYKNLRFIKKLPTTSALYFHPLKNVNYDANIQAVYYELENEKKEEINPEELKKHTPKRINQNEVRELFASDPKNWNHKFLFELLMDEKNLMENENNICEICGKDVCKDAINRISTKKICGKNVCKDAINRISTKKICEICEKQKTQNMDFSKNNKDLSTSFPRQVGVSSVEMTDQRNLQISQKISKSPNFLDNRIISQLQITIWQVDEQMQAYNMQKAVQPIIKFLDDLTNRYIRRSRRRFRKSESDADKNSAYETLYYVLIELSKISSPFMPFVSEYIYRNLTELRE